VALYLTLAATIGPLRPAWNLLRGPRGRAIVAIRDNHSRPRHGHQHARYKSVVSGWSGPTRASRGRSRLAIAFVAPDSFNILLSITLLTGIGSAGRDDLGRYTARCSSSSCQTGQDISKAAPWAIFGVFLIVFMYVMPRGIAGFLHLV